MTHLNQLPPTAAVLIAIFVVLGSSLALLGSLGLVRLKSFYQRLHAPTLAYSYGTLLIVLGSMAMFSLIDERPIVHEIVIGIFMMITTPITLLMLGRASLRRDRDAKLGHDEVVPPRLRTTAAELTAMEQAATASEETPPGDTAPEGASDDKPRD